jgi:hypothetical protein
MRLQEDDLDVESENRRSSPSAKNKTKRVQNYPQYSEQKNLPAPPKSKDRRRPANKKKKKEHKLRLFRKL